LKVAVPATSKQEAFLTPATHGETVG